MESLSPKLESILSSPEELAKILEAAKKFITSQSSGTPQNVGDASEAPTSELPMSATAIPAAPEEPAAPAMSGLLPGLNLNPKVVNAVSTAARMLNEREKRIDLLYAMKPLVKSKGGETIERAVTAIKIARAVRAAMNGLGGGEKSV